MVLKPIHDIIMRGGSHPNPELNELEKHIAQTANQRFELTPIFAEKGLKWTYNWTHFNLLWMSKDQNIIDLLYELSPYPQYIEVETTTACNLKCKICEHTYWQYRPLLHVF